MAIGSHLWLSPAVVSRAVERDSHRCTLPSYRLKSGPVWVRTPAGALRRNHDSDHRGGDAPGGRSQVVVGRHPGPVHDRVGTPRAAGQVGGQALDEAVVVLVCRAEVDAGTYGAAGVPEPAQQGVCAEESGADAD